MLSVLLITKAKFVFCLASNCHQLFTISPQPTSTVPISQSHPSSIPFSFGSHQSHDIKQQLPCFHLTRPHPPGLQCSSIQVRSRPVAELLSITKFHSV